MAFSMSSKPFSSVYEIINIGDNMDCRIFLTESKSYFMVFDIKESQDVNLNILISCGYFRYKESVIYLNDVNGYEIKLEQTCNNTLKVLSGLSFLLEKYLSPTYLSSSDDMSEIYANCIKTKHLSDIQKELNEYNASFEELFSLKYGIYDIGYYCKMVIQSDNKYSILCKDVVVLEGIWKRDRNILLLYDIHLQYTFYATIGKEGIKGKYLPILFVF